MALPPLTLSSPRLVASPVPVAVSPDVPAGSAASEKGVVVQIDLFGSRWFEHDDAALFRSISEEWLLKYFDGWDPSDEEQVISSSVIN